MGWGCRREVGRVMHESPGLAGPEVDVAGLRSRGEALRRAASLPAADLRPLLEAALGELDGAVEVFTAAGLDAAERAAGPSLDAQHSERRLLRAVFQQAPLPLLLLGRDGTVRRANLAAASLFGAGPGYVTGKLFTALADPRSRAVVQSQLAAVARTGTARRLRCGLVSSRGTVPCELTVRQISVRGDEDPLLVTIRLPAAAASGAPLASDLGATAAAERAQHAGAAIATLTRRLDLMTAATRLLLENAVSEPVTLQRCARLLADELAACVIVDVERQGRLRRHFVACRDDHGSARLAQQAAAVDPQPGSVPYQVYQAGTQLLIAHADDASILGAGSDGTPLLLLLSASSLLSVPISDGTRTHGVLTLARGSADGHFALAEAGLVQEIGEQLALAISTHRMLRQRTEALQASLRPRALPAVPGADIAVAYLPPSQGREVGGDFCDVYPASAGWGVTIGDACGNGEDAAAVTAAARHAIRVLAHWSTDPAEVLRKANDIMLADDSGSRFVTAAAAHLQWRDHRLRIALASAGHPAPVLVRPDGAAQLIQGGGLPLGVFPDAAPATQELELAPGEVLFFYTDGLIGARNPQLGYFGDRLTDGLAALAGKPPAGIVSGMQHRALEFTGRVLKDDITMLALRARRSPRA